MESFQESQNCLESGKFFIQQESFQKVEIIQQVESFQIGRKILIKSGWLKILRYPIPGSILSHLSMTYPANFSLFPAQEMELK